jgi:hypothetical protein
MPAADDWRRRGQDAYLHRARLTWRRYQALSTEWEHEHCDFCWAKFLDADYADIHREQLEADPEIQPGYTEAPGGQVPPGQHWICKKCFEDFHAEFEWELVSSDPNAWPYDRPKPTPRGAAGDLGDAG